MHPDFGLKYPVGALANPLRVLMFQLWYGAPGSLANPTLPDSRGTNGKVAFGSLTTVDSAETVPGANYFIDHSAPNNSLLRMNASAVDHTKNVGLAYGPDSATPGLPSNQWVADLAFMDVAHASGSKIGSITRDGTQLTNALGQVGVWDAVTPIGMASSEFFINCFLSGAGGENFAEFWLAQYAMWFLDAPTAASIANADGSLKAGVFAKFNTPGVGPVDLLADGTGPGIGAPVVMHEWRPGETFDKFALNKGTAGNPTVIGSTIAAVGRPFRAPVDPLPAIDRPYRAGFTVMNAVASGDPALNDTTGTYSNIKNYGQRIKAGKTLIVIWVSLGYDAGALRNASLVDQHSVAYNKAKQVNGSFGELYCFSKLADANDETAQFADWGNAPTLTWTPRGGFSDGGGSVMLSFYEGPTPPVIVDAQGAGKAAATTVTGFVADSVTATTNKALMVSGIGTLSMAFEHNISPPPTMDLNFKRFDGNKSGGWVYLAEEKINAVGATGTRSFPVDANGGNAFCELSILLQNS